MLQIHPTITINNLVNYLNHQPDLYRNIPEFHFAIPLADKVKQRGCHCGLGGDFAATTTQFSTMAQNISPESIEIIKKQLNIDKICFGVQTKHNYELKCY